MGRLHVIDFVTYRWRYNLGYITIGLGLIILLIVAGFFVPNGLTKPEMASAVVSSDLSFKHFVPEMIINAPYHMLQKVSFYLFSVSDFSIKLPSLLIGLASAIGMILLIRSWFKPNVAVLTTLIAVTTGQFLVLSQTGTYHILYLFWGVWLLLAATKVSRGSSALFAWKVTLSSFIALSFYTPLSLYILIALVIAGIFHPHIRHTIKQLSKLKLLLASLAGLVIVSPIVYALSLDPTVGLRLLGIPKEFPAIIPNLQLLFNEYFNFTQPSNGTLMTPIYTLPAVLLIVIGLYRMFTTKYTARSYIIAGWLILLVPIVIINPRVVAVTFVPFLILMALGVHYLISYWYKLFPNNPYARAAGLMPLVILIASMSFSGIERYVYGYYYDDSVAQNFSKDVSLLRHELSLQNEPVTLKVSQPESSFYHAFDKYYKKGEFITVTISPNESSLPLIVTRAAKTNIGPVRPTKIITNAYQYQSNRLYVYKKM